VILMLVALLAQPASGAPFDKSIIEPLAEELYGSRIKREVEFISRHHRMRGSRGFRAVTKHIVNELRRAGLKQVEIIDLPADGRIYYGTQRSRPPWDAERAELWEVRNADKGERVLLASWSEMPMVLAQDSESAEVTADLIDVGEGTSPDDYAGKEVRGKIVLAGAQPGEVSKLAVDRHGAAGIISYAQNQRTAWWKKNRNLVRWGHLDTFAPVPTFAFMVSLKRADELRRRLAAGEKIRLQATVKAGKHAGSYQIATGVIPGADRKLKNEEIVYSCHLDHPRPGANDNASGCATILEVARTLSRLVARKKIPPPARTIRFVWPPEIEGTLALLVARPELTRRIRAAIHLDMVGGGRVTKAIFHVTRGPATLPSFIHDVAAEVARFVNQQTADYAGTGIADFPMVDPAGGSEALQAEITPFTGGSDHQVFSEGSFRIPTIYLNDWPDRYIHTNLDSATNIDASKLERAGFIAAASGYLLARLQPSDAPWVWAAVERESLRRAASVLEQRAGLPDAETANLVRFHMAHERKVAASMDGFFKTPAEVKRHANAFLNRLAALTGTSSAQRGGSAEPADARLVFRRNVKINGPLSVFGYDYFEAHFRGTKPALLSYRGARGEGADYAYEALNLVDGKRTVGDIRDDLAAIYGPVPIEIVLEYLRALETIDVVRRARR
jgi:aminopeptidase YwaD